MYRRIVAVIALLAVAAAPALAAKKPRRCLTPADVKTEQIVRHGVFLRENGGKCEEYTPGTLDKWKAFDQLFGPRMKQQTERRAKMFQREFPDDWRSVMAHFDGRFVYYYRFYPITRAYCEDVDRMLDEVSKKGWNAFTKQAEIVQSDVYNDYKVCR